MYLKFWTKNIKLIKLLKLILNYILVTSKYVCLFPEIYSKYLNWQHKASNCKVYNLTFNFMLHTHLPRLPVKFCTFSALIKECNKKKMHRKKRSFCLLSRLNVSTPEAAPVCRVLLSLFLAKQAKNGLFFCTNLRFKQRYFPLLNNRGDRGELWCYDVINCQNYTHILVLN